MYIVKNTKNIVIGITGHRDMVETSTHKEYLIKIFQDITTRYPTAKIQLLSPLADGADRYVADIFLSIKKKESYKEKFEMIVPMPFELEEYQKDFNERSKKEFSGLLKQATDYFFVGYADGNNSTLVDKKDGDRLKRKKQYFEVGKYVADHSDILLALWDGKDVKKVGGTGEIVRYKLHRQNPLVLHIVCNRASAKAANEYTVQLLFAKEKKTIDLQDDWLGK